MIEPAGGKKAARFVFVNYPPRRSPNMRFKSTFATALCAASLTFAAPSAMGQEKKVRIQLAGAYPGALTMLGPLQQFVAERLRKLSNGSLDVKYFEPGALVPPGQYFDAIANNSLDMAWTSLGFFTGKDIAFALYSSVPFGPDVGEYMGWYRFGGGQKMMEELAAKYNVIPITCGIIAPEASGWFRKEIKTLDDLKGLKMRFFGLGANVMQKMGVQTQLLQAGEIFQALQLGTIDATEFSMPALDLSLGFHQVAKHYYFPGWHQLASVQHLLVSKQKWAELSDSQKDMIYAACDQAIVQSYAEGESKQVAAIKEIQSKGVTVHYWGKEFLDAFRKAWGEVVAEQVAKSPEFAKTWDSMSKYREEYKVWRTYGQVRE
jgi:TRAP-type mannitol/chloroaromatic compound transport system substrate-binding protein